MNARRADPERTRVESDHASTEYDLSDAASVELENYLRDVRGRVLGHLDDRDHGELRKSVGVWAMRRAIFRTDRTVRNSLTPRTNSFGIFMMSVVFILAVVVTMLFVFSRFVESLVNTALLASFALSIATVAALVAGIYVASKGMRADRETASLEAGSAELVQHVASIEKLARVALEGKGAIPSQRVSLRRLVDLLVDQKIWRVDDVQRFADVLSIRNMIVHDAGSGYTMRELDSALAIARDLLARFNFDE